MFARTLIVAGGLALALAGVVAAQTVVTGTVTRIDQPASVIVLQDGRMVRVPGGTAMINGQPMAISSIQPGTVVAIQNGQVVAYQNGVYVAADPRRAPYEVSGRVRLIDSVDNVLVLDGLRPIALTPDMQVFQDGRQVAVDSVRPGGYVTIASVTPIPFSGRTRDRVVAATPAATTTIVTPAPSALVYYTGTVSRIDSNTIVLSDGRRIPTTDRTVVLVDDRAVMISKLTPGTHVVVYPNGQQAVVAPAPSAPVSYTGTISRIDSNTIVLNDGRRVPTTDQTVVLVDNRPMMISKLTPGTQVVVYPNGQQAVVTPAPSAPISYTGTVSRIDSNTIVLSDGRRIPMTVRTVVLVDNRPMMISKLTPGTHVVVYPNGQPMLTTSETRVITTPAVVVPPEPVKLQGGLREYEASRQGI